MKQMSGLTDMCRGDSFGEDPGCTDKVVEASAGTPQTVPKSTSNANAGIGCGKWRQLDPDTGTGVRVLLRRA